MFHSTKGNDFRSETKSSTASLLCGSTVGYPSDSLASCLGKVLTTSLLRLQSRVSFKRDYCESKLEVKHDFIRIPFFAMEL